MSDPRTSAADSANGDIGIPLAATTDGTAAGAVCADDGQPVPHGLPGPRGVRRGGARHARTAAVRERSHAQAGSMRLLAEEETLKRSTADLPYLDWDVVYV